MCGPHKKPEATTRDIVEGHANLESTLLGETFWSIRSLCTPYHTMYNQKRNPKCYEREKTNAICVTIMEFVNLEYYGWWFGYFKALSVVRSLPGGGGVVFLYIIFTARVAFRLLAPSACRRASRMSSASRCVVLVLKIA